MEQENKYYVYKHLSINDKIFYIGCGQKDRVFDGGSKRNKHWKKFVWDNGGFKFEIIKNNLSKQNALRLERELIKEIGIENLTNIVGENGNSTAFKINGIPWNKGLKGVQAPNNKQININNITYESVNQFRELNNIKHTTYYRNIKSGKIIINK